ncbi:hypothetical protein ZIOFF_001475 [Zingiber officinale]|uniref:Uncharacterized protein n=1 Tax=Zingiber officinale TaxID=94328 RepID=A0A8J5IK52_ZINOF|nr:hypothetical protein ZIOFF_001475 [Zingiber officinale]
MEEEDWRLEMLGRFHQGRRGLGMLDRFCEGLEILDRFREVRRGLGMLGRFCEGLEILGRFREVGRGLGMLGRFCEGLEILGRFREGRKGAVLEKEAASTAEQEAVCRITKALKIAETTTSEGRYAPKSGDKPFARRATVIILVSACGDRVSTSNVGKTDTKLLGARQPATGQVFVMHIEQAEPDNTLITVKDVKLQLQKNIMQANPYCVANTGVQHYFGHGLVNPIWELRLISGREGWSKSREEEDWRLEMLGRFREGRSGVGMLGRFCEGLEILNIFREGRRGLGMLDRFCEELEILGRFRGLCWADFGGCVG